MSLNIQIAQPTKYKMYVVSVGMAEFIYSGKKLVACVLFGDSPERNAYWHIPLSYRQQQHLDAIRFPLTRSVNMIAHDFYNLANILLAEQAIKPFE